MPTSFPGGIDNFTDPTSTNPMNAPSPSGQHLNTNDAIEAIEAFRGTTGFANFASTLYVDTAIAEAEVDSLALTGGTMTGPIVGLQDKGGQVFNVKGYGALGNNSTDDTTAIQAAVTAAGVSGGIVFFPPGTYVTVAGITCGTDTVSFQGAGKSSILKAGGEAIPLSITYAAHVEGMFFDV